MATSPIPQWAQEMSPHHRGPTAGGVVRLAIAVVVLVIILTAFGGQDSSGTWRTPDTTVPVCARHWPPTCQEASGGR